jgi:hypothetical protein
MGMGMETWSSGATHVGEWNNGIEQCRGKQVDANGNIYDDNESEEDKTTRSSKTI